MTTVDARFDPQVWIGLPGSWDSSTWADPRDWAREVAETVWGNREPGPGEQGRDHLALALIMHAENPLNGATFRRSFLWLPHPTSEPLAVHLECYLVEGDRDQALRDLGQADPEGAVEPPVVEAFSNPALGTGLRVLRYALDPEDGSVALVLSYAFRAGGLDVLLWLSSLDPAAALGALEDVDGLARALVLLDS